MTRNPPPVLEEMLFSLSHALRVSNDLDWIADRLQETCDAADALEAEGLLSEDEAAELSDIEAWYDRLRNEEDCWG